MTIKQATSREESKLSNEQHRRAEASALSINRGRTTLESSLILLLLSRRW